MDDGLERRVSFLRAASEMGHPGGVLLDHLLGTRRLLASWGERPALCDAGLFHSVYGTEYFTPEHAAERDAVIAVIGAEAERVAWLWCANKRSTLDTEHRTARLRDDDAVEHL